jgi:NADH oxidoreductase Hcr
VIFADEWKLSGYPGGGKQRRLLLPVADARDPAQRPDLAARTVMTCGPAPYGQLKDVKALGVTRSLMSSSPVAKRQPAG